MKLDDGVGWAGVVDVDMTISLEVLNVLKRVWSAEDLYLETLMKANCGIAVVGRACPVGGNLTEALDTLDWAWDEGNLDLVAVMEDDCMDAVGTSMKAGICEMEEPGFISSQEDLYKPYPHTASLL